jgi:hypothetical protein
MDDKLIALSDKTFVGIVRNLPALEIEELTVTAEE